MPLKPVTLSLINLADLLYHTFYLVVQNYFSYSTCKLPDSNPNAAGQPTITFSFCESQKILILLLVHLFACVFQSSGLPADRFPVQRPGFLPAAAHLSSCAPT